VASYGHLQHPQLLHLLTCEIEAEEIEILGLMHGVHARSYDGDILLHQPAERHLSRSNIVLLANCDYLQHLSVTVYTQY